jgi:hypothetical protein
LSVAPCFSGFHSPGKYFLEHIVAQWSYSGTIQRKDPGGQK